MFPVTAVISYNDHKHWCMYEQQVHHDSTAVQSIDQSGVWWFHPHWYEGKVR